MERFSTKLQHRLINLNVASNIVMTSFISQKSISHLDLLNCESTLAYQRENFFHMDYAFSSLERSFFCTEENLRNNLVPKRRLLYTLHLDFPNGREYSNLRYGPAPGSLCYHPESLFAAIRDVDSFHRRLMSDLVENAFERTDCKFRLLKWIVDFRALESIWLPKRIQLFYAKHLYRECVDSEFAMKCFEKFIRLGSFSCTEEFKFLEYLLYHARLQNFDVRIKKSSHSSLTDFSIRGFNYLSVSSILKYEDGAYYFEESYDKYKQLIKYFYRRHPGFDWDAVIEPKKRMSKSRLHRMLQIIYIFGHIYYVSTPGPSDPSDALEALRLVWSSIPDDFVCHKEMNDAYEDVFPAEIISRAHSFYEEAIRQTVSRREPRPLSQFCRSMIRKTLVNNKCWLPDGIKRLKLPPRFKSFKSSNRQSPPRKFPGSLAN